jgi:short-subunit dehydrogenase
VILVARSVDKLQSVADEVRRQFPSVQAEVLPADLTGGQAEFDRLRAALRLNERCISVLLAIAGGKSPAKGMVEFAFKEFHLMTAEEEDSIYRLNCYATSQTLRLVLADMMKRKKGRIVTMSSVGMLLPYGGSAYGASKAYVATLTDALRSECAEHNIQVQCVVPAKVGNPVVGNWMQGYCSYDAFANATLDKFGADDFAVYFPYWMHAAMAWLGTVLPTWLRYLLNRRGARQLQEDLEKRS